ncbi:MAG: hypothetical protein J6A75_02280 [Lachnospiraceae bacterium]|nr:hypothetical protein [Lachnospiraceae bacterium]
MKKNEIVLLLLGMTKAGKTTKVGALSRCPEKIAEVSGDVSARTNTTVDWALGLGDEIKLLEVELNLDEILGKEEERDVAVYNENLQKKNFFKDYFGLEPKEDEFPKDELEDYVKKQVQDSIQNTLFEYLKKLMLDKKTAQYVKRIRIQLPACEELETFMSEAGIDTLVIRDTRGMLDTTADELKALPNMSVYDLGLDGVDGAILLCSSTDYPNNVEGWYKNVYSEALRSIPVFIETRHDSLFDFFQYSRSSIANISSVEMYLEEVIGGNLKFFPKLLETHFSGALRLLKGFDVVKKESDNEWKFKYNVYSLKESLYVNSKIATLSVGSVNAESVLYEDYQFYRLVNFINTKDMVTKVLEHKKLLDMIENTDMVNEQFRKFSSEEMELKSVEMHPKFNGIERIEVCDKIVNVRDYLGPRHGITTPAKNVSGPEYLAALTSAVTSHRWLNVLAMKFKVQEKLRDEAGEEIASQMNLNEQNNLVHMYISKKIFNSVDCYARYRDYIITDRDITMDGIIDFQKNADTSHLDALNAVTANIVNKVFSKNEQ